MKYFYSASHAEAKDAMAHQLGEEVRHNYIAGFQYTEVCGNDLEPKSASVYNDLVLVHEDEFGSIDDTRHSHKVLSKSRRSQNPYGYGHDGQQLG